MSNLSKLKAKFDYRISIHIFFIIFSLCFIVPFLLIIAVSLTGEKEIQNNGYKLIPKLIDFTSYKYVLNSPTQIMDAYKVTLFQAGLATFLGVLTMALCAYPLSRKDFRYKSGITFFIFFTMLFGGGLIPTYILITQYLRLGDSVWVYILPALASPFYIIVMRTFFSGIPESLAESAKIDGASELRIFFQIILPLSKPILATISFLMVLGRWNDWMTSLIYINNPKLFSLQYLLQKVLREVEFIESIASEPALGNVSISDFKVPTESIRYALCVVAAGPMLLVFPFFQKYFTRGLTIGSVKG